MSAADKAPAARARYINAFDCGHCMWEEEAASSGIDWCPVCSTYVGVIVTRVPGLPDGGEEE